MKFGLMLPMADDETAGFADLRAMAIAAEDDGLDSVWLADHLIFREGDETTGIHEAWTVLTAVAAITTRVQIGPLVLALPFRNPALTAKMASTLQVLSGGRFMLGIGGGWREDEYRSYGYEFPPASVRLHQLEEVVQICRLMWTEPHPTFRGEYFAIDDAAATPRPDVVPPICIGAKGERIALPVVGRCADMWNTGFSSDEDWRRKRAIVDAAAEAAGRDPASIASCATVAGDLPDSDTASEQWRDRVQQLVDLGVAHIVLDFGHPLDPEPAVRFGEQVIAAFRS